MMGEVERTDRPGEAAWRPTRPFLDKTFTEPVRARAWTRRTPPRRILAIRLGALGDVVITLPYLQDLRQRHPQASIDLLTRRACDDVPRALDLFARVFSLGGGPARRQQLLGAVTLLPRLVARRYDVVIDLQRSDVSRLVRRLVMPSCWAEFDRFSPLAAGERTRRTIEAAGLGPAGASSRLRLKDDTLGLSQLRQGNWRDGQSLVVLNPAGGWPTKNWPLRHYAEFARLWREGVGGAAARFVVLGTAAVADRAAYLRTAIGDALIDLVGRTTPSEAFAIVRRAALVVSDDSGLMHMAWVCGVPTLALFGASRSDWSAPQGPRSLCLGSSDLPCGECMSPVCAFGDVHCLTRRTPALVYELARALVAGP
jgi:heptosyltransferase II